MNVELALLITLHPTEAAEPHRLRVVIQDIDGEQIAQLDGQFGIDAAPPSPTGRQPGESLILPVGLNLRGVAIPREGSYSVEVLVDNQHVESLFFMVTPQRGPEAAEPSED
jgi:hypothetical protein